MIGLMVAMGAEYRLMEALLTDKEVRESKGFGFLTGRVASRKVVLMQTGIGKVNAAIGTVEMINRFAPDCIINTGVAGGIDEVLRVMDIVVGTEVVYHDVWCGEGNEVGQVQGMPARYRADEGLVNRVMGAISDVNICSGLICSGDRFITDADELKSIKKNFPEGLAVDMESGAIAQVCYRYQVPFLNLRIISDTPGHVENHALQYRDFWTAAPEKSFGVLRQLIEQIG